MVHISATMMLKNEEKRLHVTLQSIVGIADSCIVFDTGSTDTTLDILNSFCDKTGITLHLKQGEFIDFSTSRNEMLDFADTVEGVDYLLLLDCNDEVKNPYKFRKYIVNELSKYPTESAWLVRQEWFSGVYNSYYNLRLIRTRKSWRYNGVVHEWLGSKDAPGVHVTRRLPEELYLYQDRTQDDDKSGKRFHRDRVLLLAEYAKDPTEPRTVFYLAQTCSCLNIQHEAYRFYLERTKLVGFHEEVFQSYLRMGDICKDHCLVYESETQPSIREIDITTEDLLSTCTWKDALYYYIKAYECIPRAEPIVAIAEYYRLKEQFSLSYHFAKMACELEYPTTSILFVDNFVYTYTRYHILGIVAYYCNRFKEGYEACKKAIEAQNRDIDKKNLSYYEPILFPPTKKEKKRRRR